jgi:hypothetical protein
MKMPKPMPARPVDTLKRKSDLIMNSSLKAETSCELASGRAHGAQPDTQSMGDSIDGV